jgi:hypothetical protein
VADILDEAKAAWKRGCNGANESKNIDKRARRSRPMVSFEAGRELPALRTVSRTMTPVGGGESAMTRQMSRFPRKRESRAARAVCAIVLVAGVALPAGAADFYAGKTINFVVVVVDVGGGFSIYARTIGKYLARYIPGSPTVVVKNMPGAGGATASAWLYRIAAKDGTAIASVLPNAILGKLIDESQGQYDPARASRTKASATRRELESRIGSVTAAMSPWAIMFPAGSSSSFCISHCSAPRASASNSRRL